MDNSLSYCGFQGASEVKLGQVERIRLLLVGQVIVVMSRLDRGLAVTKLLEDTIARLLLKSNSGSCSMTSCASKS